ncbi:MAG TPA: hypothetical protein VFX99_15580 [Microbacterium sp.]|nr:hypothetical protein [Microbacterium sp.]
MHDNAPRRGRGYATHFPALDTFTRREMASEGARNNNGNRSKFTSRQIKVFGDVIHSFARSNAADNILDSDTQSLDGGLARVASRVDYHLNRFVRRQSK